MTYYRDTSALGHELGRAIGRHLELAFRELARGPKSVHEAAYFRLQTGEAHPFGNFAILTDSRDMKSALAAIEPFASQSVPSAVILPDMEPTVELEALLAAGGFARHGGLPAMAVDIEKLPATALPRGYTFERIIDGIDGEHWTRQLSAGYGLPYAVARYFSPVSAPSHPAADARVQFFAVREGDDIVGTSALCLGDGLAGIYCVSTLPEARGKGLGAHATVEPLRLAASLGYGVGVLQSSEAGYSVYQRLGFGDFGQIPLYIRMPPE